MKNLIAITMLPSEFSYIKGLCDGGLVIILLGLMWLFAVRRHRTLLAGWSFALTMALFVELDLGFAGPMALSMVGQNVIRAIIESALVGTLAICLAVFTDFSLFRSAFGIAMGCMAGVAIAIAGYGLVHPEQAMVIARMAFVLLAVTGLIVGIIRRQARASVDSWLIFWIALVAYSALAVAVETNSLPVDVAAPALSGGAVLLLVVMSVVLLRFAIFRIPSLRVSLVESEMADLALSGGRHVMWEWRPLDEQLGVGLEMPKLLDMPPEPWESDSRAMLHGAMHPLDLPAYLNVAERDTYKPGERIQLELRLRSSDGSYNWYELRARALAGIGNAVDCCLGTLTNIDRLKSVAENVVRGALHDHVTGLANAALFMDRIERSQSAQGAMPFRIVTVDIDRFKALNEGLGHDTGDMILKVVAERLQSLVGPDETVARQRGSQFVLHCQESDLRGDFRDFAKSIERVVGTAIQRGAQHIAVTASVGISESSSTGAAIKELTDQSNVALMEALNQGGKRAVFFKSNMRDSRAHRFSLESDLHKAVPNNEIEIFYQPIVDLLTMEVRGFEALARWRHPVHGLLPPSEFMDVADASGLMSDISQFMLSGVARQLGIWQRVHMRGKPFFVSVNVSATQLTSPFFAINVMKVLDKESLEHSSLKIEITETVIMRQPERSASVMKQLRGMGVSLACDDFGTGFSSLASLRDFPFDTLKLDRSFVLGEDFEERNATIISSIATLAQSLGMVVVAEGIETQQQIDMLAALGCTLGQGYFLGVPETAEAAGARLLRQARPGVVPVEAEKTEDAHNNDDERDGPTVLPRIPSLLASRENSTLKQSPRFGELAAPDNSTPGFAMAANDIVSDTSDPQEDAEELPSIFGLPPGGEKTPKAS